MGAFARRCTERRTRQEPPRPDRQEDTRAPAGKVGYPSPPGGQGRVYGAGRYNTVAP